MKHFRTRGAGKNPTACHPSQHRAVKAFFAEAHAQQRTIASIADRAGLSRVQIAKWKTRHTPTVTNIEAALNTVGLELKVVPIKTVEAPCLADYYLVEY